MDDAPFPGSLETVYQKYYACPDEGEFLLLRHPTNIFLLCLGPQHPVVKAESMTVNSVVFDESKVSAPKGGRKKKWAKGVKPSEKIGTISTEDGTEYTIPACIHGKLFEVNERLAEKPNLVRSSPQFNGYLAIIQGLSREFKEAVEQEKLKSHENYEKSLPS